MLVSVTLHRVFQDVHTDWTVEILVDSNLESSVFVTLVHPLMLCFDRYKPVINVPDWNPVTGVVDDLVSCG